MRTAVHVIGGMVAGGAAVAAGVLLHPAVEGFVRTAPTVILGWL